MRYGPRALAGSWLAAAALLLAACGSSTPGLLSSDQAGTLNAALDRVNTKFHRHHCAAAQNAAERLRGQIEHLPNSVNPTVRRALAQGALTVEQYVAQDCVQQPVQTAPATPTTPTTPPTTQSAPTPPPPKQKTKTTQTTTNPGATPPSNAGNKPKNNGQGNGQGQGKQGD